MVMQPSEAQVRELVRQALQRLAREQPGPVAPAPPDRPSPRPIVDAEVVRTTPQGSSLELPANALITPLARDLALERQVTLSPSPLLPTRKGSREKAIALGADHGGYGLKEELKAYLVDLGWEPVDCGTFGPDSVDYPDYAFAVARLVSSHQVQWGIIVDGAGIGSCMAANKVPGVRAAMCYDQASAANSREHNHANILTLGAGLIGPSLARQIVKTWLNTPFGPGRHARRVDKITAIEQRYLKR
jgi:ribose 5-phosphate isomerase B